jgi:hypothetical protein
MLIIKFKIHGTRQHCTNILLFAEYPAGVNETTKNQ